MPEYKLIYFNNKGRAEAIRWIFTYAGIPFTDERIEMDDWPERKPDIPGGKLPVLMIDDKPLVQSLAIARYAAKEAGLVPEDNLDAAYCDALADTFDEIMSKFATLMRSTEDPEEKQKFFEEEFFPNSFEPLMKKLNGRLEEREWFVTDEVTWADLLIGRIMSQLLEKHPSVLEQFPAVAAHVEKVCELPAIKEWIENCPETEF